MSADKRAVVTGASSGIGAATAIELGRRGARVLAVGRDSERLRQTVDAIGREGGEAFPYRCDLTAASAPDDVAREAERLMSGIDVLVNAAGVFEPLPFAETPVESLDGQWEINVRGPFRLTQACLPLLPRGASIVFLSSICGHTGFPDSVAYCATKGAVELMMRALAVELGPAGIRVNAVAPGWIATRMNDHLLADSEFSEHQVAGTPLGRIGEPDDIAPVIAQLASDETRFMTGASVHVDGGYPAAPPLR